MSALMIQHSSDDGTYILIIKRKSTFNPCAFSKNIYSRYFANTSHSGKFQEATAREQLQDHCCVELHFIPQVLEWKHYTSSRSDQRHHGQRALDQTNAC